MVETTTNTMTAPPPKTFQVLVFTKTAAYRHESIPAGIAAVARLSAASLCQSSSTSPGLTSPVPFTTHATEDASIFDPSTLAPFTVIVLLNTSGTFLSGPQLAALRDHVHRGGGVVGVHCATTGMLELDADPERWYARLLGAEFNGHPAPQGGVVRVVDADHGIVKGSVEKGEGKWWVGDEKEAGEQRSEGNWRWGWFDEWYNFKVNPKSVGDLHVLLSVDEGSYEGGEHGADHPIAWCQEFEGGRSFYTALGHFDEAYQDEAFMRQLLNGILWAARIIE